MPKDITREENKLFKWLIPLLIGILFSLLGIIYSSLKEADASISIQVKELKSHQDLDNQRFQNINGNIYIICKQLSVNCVPTLEEK